MFYFLQFYFFCLHLSFAVAAKRFDSFADTLFSAFVWKECDGESGRRAET